MTVDPANDLVLIALGNATDQNYGNSRPGANLYATTLLVLQASTGKRKWHFQMTHHDIYDWDLASPPTLVEAVKDGQRVPVPPLIIETGEERRVCEEAHARRAQRLKRKAETSV